jgi:hypothetical protein
MRWGRFVNKPKTYSQDLSAGALSITTDFPYAVRIESITIHASVPITELITITKDSHKGANYDTVLRKGNFNSSQDFVYMPDGEFYLHTLDQLKLQCTNANTTGTVYVTINWSEA